MPMRPTAKAKLFRLVVHGQEVLKNMLSMSGNPGARGQGNDVNSPALGFRRRVQRSLPGHRTIDQAHLFFFSQTGHQLTGAVAVPGCITHQKPDARGGILKLALIKNLQSQSLVPNFYHFRSYSGAEVDLILEMNGTLYPIEIKTKSNPSRKDVRGFAVLRECFPQENIHDGLLICSLDRPTRLSDTVVAIPWWLV